MRLRPGMHRMDDEWHLRHGAEFYHLVASILDIRAYHGEAGAREVGNAIRTHIVFVKESADLAHQKKRWSR